MPDCSKSAEFLDKPSGLTLAQGPYGGRRAGAALRTGSAPTRRPNPPTVTFLNGRNSDISKWWTHDSWPGARKNTRCGASRFSIRVSQRETSIALYPQQRRFALAEAGKKYDGDCISRYMVNSG